MATTIEKPLEKSPQDFLCELHLVGPANCTVLTVRNAALSGYRLIRPRPDREAE